MKTIAAITAAALLGALGAIAAAYKTIDRLGP